MEPSQIRQIAERQLSDKNRNPGTFFDSNPVITVDEAYAIQFEVKRMRTENGERVAGFKVGCTGADIRQLFGLDGPIRGFVFSSEVHESGARISYDSYANLSIEGELAIQLDSHAKPAEILPVIELHNKVFRSNPRTLQELIANNGIHAGVVMRSGTLTRWDQRPASGLLKVFVNDELVDQGDMYGVPGGPEGSLQWLRGHLLDYYLELAPMSIVLLGTPLGLYPVKSGDRIVVDADGIGSVEAEVV